MPPADQTLYFLTGPIQSGKTSSLQDWSLSQPGVCGILTPVTANGRLFLDLATREPFPMEAGADEAEVLLVGRFRFSKAGFDKAIKILRNNLSSPGWLILDEIGPLELRGEGFHDVLRELLERRKGKTILVVREGLVARVQDYFGCSGIQLSDIREISS